jgi:hypothetical protein
MVLAAITMMRVQTPDRLLCVRYDARRVAISARRDDDG